MFKLHVIVFIGTLEHMHTSIETKYIWCDVHRHQMCVLVAAINMHTNGSTQPGYTHTTTQKIHPRMPAFNQTTNTPSRVWKDVAVHWLMGRLCGRSSSVVFKDMHPGDLGMEFAWDRTAAISIFTSVQCPVNAIADQSKDVLGSKRTL